MGSLMSRTWLLRGVAVAVFAVLVGAWAMGFAPTDDKPPPPENVVSPVSPDKSRAPDGKRSTGPEKTKPRRTREATPSQAAFTEPSPDTVAEPTDDGASTPAPTSPDPTSDPPEPSDSPTRPPQTPSNPPTQPEEECTGLGDALDCVLEPITDRP
jgi:hypothetical protein